MFTSKYKCLQEKIIKFGQEFEPMTLELPQTLKLIRNCPPVKQVNAIQYKAIAIYAAKQATTMILELLIHVSNEPEH
jgi:hypothetical protein